MTATGPTAIAELLSRRMGELGGEQGRLSLRDVVRRSGGRLAVENVRRILAGEHQGNFSDRVLSGLSMALEVPASELYRVAGLPRPDSPWVLPEELHRLDQEERRQVEALARLLLRARDKGRRAAVGE